MSLEWIRETYKVPAFKGRVILFQGEPVKIAGSNGPHLRVWKSQTMLYIHPTWSVQYPEEEE